MALRGAEDRDLGFIFDSWRKSGLDKFLVGEYQPFERFEETYQSALKFGNTKLLTRLFQSSIGEVMNASWKNIAVICDTKDPRIIYAWGCPEYQYVKHLFRDIGIEELLATLRR